MLKTNNTQENSKTNPVMNEIGKYSAEDFNMCTTKVSLTSFASQSDSCGYYLEFWNDGTSTGLLVITRR